MQNILTVFSNKKVLSFALFNVIFFTFMWMSKTLHILFFEQNNSMAYFGVSYSAMALAGYFSFFIGYFTDFWGVRKTLGIGGLLYGVGILLRIYPDSIIIATLSGIMSGAGASCVLCGIRVWMINISNSETTASMIGIKSSMTALGTALGCLGAGFMPVLFHSYVGNREVLAACGIGVLFLTASLLFSRSDIKTNKKVNNSTNWKEIFVAIKGSRRVAVICSVLGLTTGFYVSFIGPYLPLILKDRDFSFISIGLSTASFSVMRFFLDPIISQYIEKNKEHALRIFLFSELLMAAAIGMLIFPLSKEGFILVLLLRSFILGFSTISEEVIWIKNLPKEKIGLFMGLNQSSFLLGDFLGGLGNGIIYKSFGLNICIMLALFIILLNAGLFFTYFKKKNISDDESLRLKVIC